GVIQGVGCKADCDADPACSGVAGTATTITCPQGVVSPGLINTHDHITYTQNSPYTPPMQGGCLEPLQHRHAGRQGSDGHTKIPASARPTNDNIWWGELRFLLGGATSTVGSEGNATPLGLLRNLDKAALEDGLNQTPANFDTFPLNDSTPPSGFPGAVACT